MEGSPKRLGDFEIIRELGRGGMGVVYEARQKSLNRQVALKVLSTGLGLTTKAVMRFKREAEAAAKLHHTNIVPIYSTGEENRVPYYAMELVNGPSLDQVIRQLQKGTELPAAGSLDSTTDGSSEGPNGVPDWVAGTIGFEPPCSRDTGSTSTSDSGSSPSFASGSSYYDNVAGMMAGVADALAHAHGHGVIHRDIKPSNLLLSQDGRLSVNDFGLARMLEQPGMTISGELMGSPMYMSPEQIAVGRIPLDHRTDIYSLGAALYELITLQTPFEGRQRDQVLSQIIHKEPARPRTVNKQIPKDLETICLKAMEKDPDRRYQTADTLAQDLRHFVDRQAISARRIGPLERAGRWARKNKALTTMACLTLIISVSAAAFVYLSQRKQHREEFQREALTAAMSGDLDKANENMQEAMKYGADQQWSLMISSHLDSFRGEVAASLEKLESAVKLDPGNLTAQYMLAKSYRSNGNWAKYRDKLDELSSRYAITSEEKLFKGDALGTISPQEGIRVMDEAIEDRPGFHLAWLMRADARASVAKDRNDEDQILLALKEIEHVSLPLGEESPVLRSARIQARLAAYHIYKRQGKTEEANKFLEAAAGDVEFLARYPRYLSGNLQRMHYFDIVSNIKGIEEVMQDVVKYGNKGFIVDTYVTAYYRAERFAEALVQLERMPDQDDPYVAGSRVLLLSETAEGRKQGERICKMLLRQGHLDSELPAYLLLVGKKEDAIEEARKLYAKRKPSKYWELPRDLIGYVAGQIEENELLERIGNSERDQAEAYLIIGLHKLAHGDRKGAKAFFDKGADSLVYWTNAKWARAFSERMEKDPEWPDWLPSETVGGKPK